jgi:hypothetical protein
MERSSARQALDMAAPAVVLVGLLFLLRAASQTPDGLSYAVAVRTGLDMFHPHHMIYVPVARAIHLATGADPITAALWQNLFWTVVLAFAGWRLAGLVFSGRTSRVLAAGALLATRGVMIYSVRVETCLPALACLALATALAAARPVRPWLLAPALALAVLYHQTNVLFVLPLMVLMAPGPPGAAWWAGKGRAILTLGTAAGLVLIIYAAGFRIEGSPGGFWAFTLSYARAPIEAWGNFGYYSPGGVSLLAVSQMRMILPVPGSAALLGSVVMSAAIIGLVAWHIRRIHGKAALLVLRLFSLVFLAVYLLFFLWWMPSDADFFLATLLPLWLLGLILVADLPRALHSLPLAAAVVFVLAAGNIIFTILPMHGDPGDGRALALALDRAAPVGVEMVTGYSVQQEMLYFTGRTRVHEGDGLARAVLAGEAPWPGTVDDGTVIVIEGPYLRKILERDDLEATEFLRWLVRFDAQEGECLVLRALPQADGLVLGPGHRQVSSWQALVDEFRELSLP